MNQVVGSIMVFVHKSHADVAMYTERVPADLKLPSIYFPPPNSVGSQPQNSQSRREMVSVYAKVFHRDVQRAYELAKEIEQQIAAERYIVQLVDELTGQDAGRSVRLDKIEVRMLDQGVVQIEFSWGQSVRFNEPAPVPNATSVTNNISVGGGLNGGQ